MVARGAIQFASVAAVIKVYFLLKASCVCARLPGRWSGARSPARARRWGLQVVLGRNWPASEGGAAIDQVELPGGGRGKTR